MRASFAPVDSESLLAALIETGAIGSTVRQLASRLEAEELPVAQALERLARDGDAIRLGRGLWVLRDFEQLNDRDDFTTPAEYVERFATENGVTLGHADGPITFSGNGSLPVHRWWPYVQGYSAEFVRDLLGRLELTRGSTVLDPFCGSGTTLVEARLGGLRAIGYDLLPIAVLAARVKTQFELPPRALAGAVEALLARAAPARPGPDPFLRETSRQFSPTALRRLKQLRNSLPTRSGAVSDALKIAFGRILIPVSRLRRSPCLGYDPTSRPFLDPFEAMREACAEMADDLVVLKQSSPAWGPRSTAIRGDARMLEAREESVDVAITSPPYVNGMDYVMNYKVDLAWLGFARSYRDLSALRGSLVSCDNLPRDEAAKYLLLPSGADPWLQEIMGRIATNLRRKGSYRRQDVHGIVHRYFADLLPVLRQVYHALKPGARFVLVIGDSLLAGTYVPGDLLVARTATRVGFVIEAVDVARSRRSGQRRSFRLRESVVTLRRPVGGRVPMAG